MTFDQLHKHLRSQMRWYQRWRPKFVTRRALRAAVQQYGYGDWSKAAQGYAKVADRGSIWIMLIIEAIKILVPLLIEWLSNREENQKALEAMRQ